MPDVREVPLTRGLVAVIDECDWPLVAKYKWYAHPCSKTGKYDAATTVAAGKGKRVTFTMHRLLMNFPPTWVDHRDRNQLNNRRSNLRLCNPSENQQNRSLTRHTSKFKGVSWSSSSRRWVAQVAKMGRKYHIGRFESELLAAREYDAMAAKLFGEFAKVNFPEALKETP